MGRRENSTTRLRAFPEIARLGAAHNSPNAGARSGAAIGVGHQCGIHHQIVDGILIGSDMTDIIRSLGKFFYRDVFFIVSGLIIISAAFQLIEFRAEPIWDGEIVGILFVIAIAYAVGLLNQELCSQLPFVKTCTHKNYNGFLRGVYRRHMGEEWQYRHSDAKALAEDPDYQRTVNLKQIGSALGSGLLTSSVILEVAAVRRSQWELAQAGVVMLFLGILFILMSWLHNMRQSAFKAKLPGLPPAGTVGGN
ncbi:MAG TPA: hypothetical protein VGB04_12555 [Allosphingosinicella sp.]|jgi:hypothetical protein